MSEFDKEVMWAVSGTGDDFQCVHVDFAKEQQAEIERLRKGIQDYLDGSFGPDFPTKHDKCPHGRFGWEDCGNCIDEYFTALLAAPPRSP